MGGEQVPPTLVALRAVDDSEAWRSVGFTVSPEGACTIGQVTVEVGTPEGDDGGGGLASWWLGDLDGAPEVDGLPCAVAPDLPASRTKGHANGTVAVDHLVVATPDVGRTVKALESIGLELRRTRDGEAYGRPMRQAFFRIGEPILEVVGPPEPAGTGPASFFGLALTVADLDATATLLGTRLGQVKDAVQPGRRIATLRSGAGLRTALAFMSA